MKKILVVLMCAGLAGCATGYHRVGFTGGYSEAKIQEDIFKVRFEGNTSCKMGRAVDFTLLRCAEVTLENGYKYFIIIDEQTRTKTGTYTTPVTANTYGTVDANGNYSGTTYYTGGQTYTLHKPRTSNTIKCFKEKPVNIPTIVYDAQQVRDNVRKQYGIK